jgi:DNA-binding CsgD family transcriptional regulator
MKQRAGPSDSKFSEGALPGTIGICVKDLNRRVLFQNHKCVEACGTLTGVVCEKTCMRRFIDAKEDVDIGLGTHLELGLLSDDGTGGAQLIDAVVINDGCSITTVFSSVPEKILKAHRDIKDCKLSRSQRRVFELVLAGLSNQAIAKALFISVPTVRTHLTRIYQKIPKELLRLLLAGSARRSATT